MSQKISFQHRARSWDKFSPSPASDLGGRISPIQWDRTESENFRVKFDTLSDVLPDCRSGLERITNSPDVQKVNVG